MHRGFRFAEEHHGGGGVAVREQAAAYIALDSPQTIYPAVLAEGHMKTLLLVIVYRISPEVEERKLKERLQAPHMVRICQSAPEIGKCSEGSSVETRLDLPVSRAAQRSINP